MTKLKPLFLLIFAMWFIWAVNLIIPVNLNMFGIKPRSISGLIGIICSPFLHANLAHILSNTIPLLFLGSVTIMFYRKLALDVFILGSLIGGILVWIFARNAIHIGASGLIYSLASFLIFFGIFKKNIKSVLISILIIFTYGGLVWGVLPLIKGVSWEGHLFGAIAGFIIAYLYKNKKI